MLIGIDWGGTKMEVIALGEDGTELARKRVDTPRHDYEACVRIVAGLVSHVEAETGLKGTVGCGIPGSANPRTGLIRNANSTWLNGRPLAADLEAALNRPVRLSNDANCLAVSEAVDGAGAGYKVVVGAIIGTGHGTGIAIDGRPFEGGSGSAGELGHVPLPWMTADELPGEQCWCGLRGCTELYVSGTGFSEDYFRATGVRRTGREIVAARRAGEAAAEQTYRRYVSRLGRTLAVMIDLIDPDIVVLGGGMSNIEELPDDLPAAIAPFVFGDGLVTRIARAQHGDSSGVRGAAWLWKGAMPQG